MNEKGFSLVEALVALTIIAVAGLALTNVSAQTIRNAATLEERLLAGIVAQNTLIETITTPYVPISTASGHSTLADRNWQWTLSVSRDAPRLTRITVAVQPKIISGHPTGPAISITGWKPQSAQ